MDYKTTREENLISARQILIIFRYNDSTMTTLLDITNSSTISRCPTTADAGTTLRVWREGHVGLDGYYHYGIADGNGGVIHASKIRGVVHDKSLEKFEKRGSAQIDNSITSNDLHAAYQNAWSAIGEPYDFLSHNCEHFVRWAHGLPKECRQLQRRLIVAGGISLAKTSKNPHIQGAASFASVGAALDKNPKDGAVKGVMVYGGVLALNAVLDAVLSKN